MVRVQQQLGNTYVQTLVSTMTDIVCPDNSTTCLLRALLNDNTSKLVLEQLIEANNQYDWNPVTLGFTVAIGVLAFIVAVVTVFQGCLAAGPGRLKAGYQAIGPWYIHSDVIFSWYQLAARSTARTPFIDMGTLTPDVSALDPKEVMEPVTSYQRLRNQLLFGFEKSQLEKDVSPYNASWANLLRAVRLTETNEFGPLTTWHTDYIEESLRAAPASGMMRSLVFLTTYVNDSCLIACPKEAQSRLYCVRGLSSDLISRDLETMGPAAAYVCFGSPESLAPYGDHSAPGRADLIASFHLFNGKIPFGETELCVLGSENDVVFTTMRRKLRGSVSHLRTLNGFFETNQCLTLLALCIGDVILRPRAFPKRSMYLIEAIAALSKSSMWRLALVKRFRASFLELANLATGEDPSGQQTNWLFPARHREVPFLKLTKLDNVSMQKDGPSWISTPSTPWLRKSVRWDAKIEIASIVYALTRSIARRPEFDPEKVRESESKSILEEIHGDRLATDQHRVLVQNEILCVDEWLRQREENDPNVVMCALMVLMKIVDTHDGLPASKKEDHHNDRKKRYHNPNLPAPINSLSPKDRSEAMKSAFIYVGEKETFTSNTGSLNDDESDVDDELGSNAETNPDSYRGKMKVDKTQSDDDDFWCIVEVLRYRALLYAAMLDLCADSSAFQGNYTDFAVKII